MTTPNPILVAGIDVGKAKLDVHIAEGSLERQFHNDKCGRRALRNWLLKRAVTRAAWFSGAPAWRPDSAPGNPLPLRIIPILQQSGIESMRQILALFHPNIVEAP